MVIFRITHHMLPNTVFSQDRGRKCMRIKRSANVTDQRKHKVSPGPLSKDTEVDDRLQEPLAGAAKRRGDFWGVWSIRELLRGTSGGMQLLLNHLYPCKSTPKSHSFNYMDFAEIVTLVCRGVSIQE